jgi:hypothetical protein
MQTVPVYVMNSGSSAQRPVSPSDGMFRFNTTTGYPEWYSSEESAWYNFYQQKSVPIEYFIVGGGGGGGGFWSGINWGTGGYGGYTDQSIFYSSIGNSLTVTVGSGGAGGIGQNGLGSNGNQSAFGQIVINGGDRGPNDGTGLGGDGAGNVNNNIGGYGGIGITYQSVKYAGGGSGGNSGGTSGAPADHGVNYGGGFGTNNLVIANSIANRGGGGYGGVGGTPGVNGAPGSSGVVILSYPDSYPLLTSISAGLTYTFSSASRLGYRVYTFTAGTGSVVI